MSSFLPKLPNKKITQDRQFQQDQQDQQDYLAIVEAEIKFYDDLLNAPYRELDQLLEEAERSAEVLDIEFLQNFGDLFPPY